jgi:phenylpropionate dioxygenase-like ring-hydroxylating dioxygenase large terminal subunit
MTQETGTAVDARREERIRRALDHLRCGTTDQFGCTAGFRAGEYTDTALAERERELVFGRVPSIVAHSSELPSPMDFITVRMPRNNLIVVRQRDGGVKCLVNVCRHRGAMLENQAAGSRRLFSCPYHRWSYDLDGKLRTVTRAATFGDLDPAEHGLVEVPSQERHGFIWVVDSAAADIDVAAWLGPEMDEILAGYELGSLQCYRAREFDEPVNWKIMQDAFLDGYHIQYAHPNSAGKHIHTNVATFEDFGRHSRWIALRKTIDRWLDTDPGDESLAGDVIETHFLLPNSTLLRQPDHFELLTFRPHPVDPNRSVMAMRLLVPALDQSGLEPGTWERRWEKNWDILIRVLYEEDFPLLRDSQVALGSRDAGPMLLGSNEVANQIFRRELGRLLRPDAGPGS